MKSHCFGILVGVVVLVAGCGDDSPGDGPECGNGTLDGTEVCDGADLGGETCVSLGFSGGDLSCAADCSFDTNACEAPLTCGNGTIEAPEECDRVDFGGQTCRTLGYAGGLLVCTDDCRIDPSLCVTAPECGNGERETGEECDGADLGGQTCEGLGYVGGTLGCTETCAFERSECEVPPNCGNGVKDPDEQCEGTDFGGQTCAGLGYDGGDLACRADCTFDTTGCYECGDGVREGPEECDGFDLAGATCLSAAGYQHGNLACTPGCAFDTSGCHTCGNSIAEGPEACDAMDFGSADCLSETGHTDGDLLCLFDCTVDISQCHTCGDGQIQGPEACDATNLAGENCVSLGYPMGGVLACGGNCTFDVTGCCGDGILGGAEQCDGTDLGGNACPDVTAYQHGTLACAGDCTYDTAGCHTCGNSTVEGPEECDDGNQVDWDGCTDCFITEFQVNTYTTGFQQSPAVSSTADGTCVVVWDSHGQDGSLCGIFGQRFNADGDPVGGEFQVNSFTTGDQYGASVSAAADGRFVVVWTSNDQDGSGDGVFGQRFDASGNPLGGEFQVNSYTLGFQRGPHVSVVADGRFLVVWSSDDQDGSDYGVFGQRFDANGNPVGGEFQVNSYALGDQRVSSVSVASDGSFVVVWRSQDASSYGVFGQRFDAAGNPTGGEFQVNSYTFLDQLGASVSMSPIGSYVVVWKSQGQDGSGDGVFGQRFDATGNTVGPEFQVNTYTSGNQLGPFVCAADDGRFVVGWSSEGQDGSVYGVFGQRFDASGNPAGAEFQINSYTFGGQYGTPVSCAADGRFVAVWTSEDQDGHFYGVFGQRYDANGQPRGVLPW